MHKFIAFILIVFSTCEMFPQLAASQSSLKLGELGGRCRQIEIPILNQCKEDLIISSIQSTGNSKISLPRSLDSYGLDYVTVSPSMNTSGRFKQFLIMKSGEDEIRIKLSGRLKSAANMDCYDFKKQKVKIRTRGQGIARSARTSVIRIYTEKEKNSLFVADPHHVPYAHIVALVDASGSMGGRDKLEQIKEEIRHMVDQLRPTDFISILKYNEYSEVVLNKISCARKNEIYAAIESIEAGGFTNGKEGIETALDFVYNAQKSGISNHIIMFTDGDFNLGDEQKEIESYLTYRSKNMRYKLSLISVMSEKEHASKMKALSKSGNGYYFVLNKNKDDEQYMDKILIKQLSS